jgi:PKD repeat protein
LSVTDNDEGAASANGTIEVVNNPPVANAGGPYTGYTNQEITLDASNSYDSDGEIINYTWDFGDSNMSYGAIVKHIFSEIGNYSVTLTVKDECGSSTNTTIITITEYAEEKKTPGFEIIIVIYSLALLFFLKRKRKN